MNLCKKSSFHDRRRTSVPLFLSPSCLLPPVNEVLDTARADRLTDELHALYRRIQETKWEAWKEHAKLPHLRSRLATLFGPLQKNVQNALDGVRATRRYGGRVAETTGVSIGAQLPHQLRLYAAHRVPADCYYALGMFKEDVRKKARFFLGDEPASTLLHHLSTTVPDEEYAPLHEKRTFWRHCREHDLPAVPLLAVFDNGSLQEDIGDIGDALPPRDLFSKPVTAFLGKGTRKWTYEEGQFRDDTGRTYAPSAVIEALQQQSLEETILLQPCVYDHPQLQALTGCPGPSTVRVITLRRPDDPPEYFAGFLTTPLKDVPAPTFSGESALAARVDESSGRLGRPRCKRASYLLGERSQHPATGRPVTGFELPHWDDAKALALQAHTTLPNVPCVGWDVMLTPDGPRLLEGNYDCSAALTQITHQQLLGLTRFPVYLTEHLHQQEGTGR